MKMTGQSYLLLIIELENPYTSPDASKPGFWKSGVDLDSAFVEQTIQGQKELEELKGMVLDNYTR